MFARTENLPTYQHSHHYYCKDKHKNCYRVHTVRVPYKMDWVDACKSMSTMLLAAIFRGQADIMLLIYRERAEQMEHHPEGVFHLVITESVLQLTCSLSEHRGYCQPGRCCAGIPESYLLADQPLWETPNTSVSMPTQTIGCWISQAGSGFHSYKLQLQHLSHARQLTVNISMIFLLLLCSVHLKLLCNESSLI